ncbi:MAG: tetratricopeptide repeat protein [Spirochaetaceae bacterium]|nr:MAG: tetratricopeptide repeat protein [Spirochaetaceae bacterium]
MMYPKTRYQSTPPSSGTRRATVPPVLMIAAPVTFAVVLFFLTGGFGLWAHIDSRRDLETLWQYGDFRAVFERAEALLEETPMQVEPLVFAGLGHFYAGMEQSDLELRSEHLERAVVFLRKALLVPKPPLEAEVHHVLGKAYFHRGPFYFDASVSHIERAIELGLVTDDSFEYLAVAYDGLNRFAESVESYTEAIRRSPNDLLLVGLAEIHVRHGQYEAAREYLVRAISTSPDEYLIQRARFQLGRVALETGRFEEAATEFRTILDVDPTVADAHFKLGRAYQMMEQPERARFHWREAIRIEPRHTEALRSLRAN